MKTGYFIKRKNTSPIILSIFQDSKDYDKWEMRQNLEYKVSSTLETDELELLDKTVFAQIDRGINRFIQDKKYFPRLFLSALVFLVVYFFFSYTVRDPIPIIDEFILATAGAIITWLFMEKKALSSDISIKRKLELKQRQNEAVLTIENDVEVVENYLDELRSINVLDLCDMIVRCHDKDLPSLPIKQENFGELIENYFKLNYKKYSKYLNQLKVARTDVDLNVQLNSRLVEIGQVDMDLLCLLALVCKANE